MGCSEESPRPKRNGPRCGSSNATSPTRQGCMADHTSTSAGTYIGSTIESERKWEVVNVVESRAMGEFWCNRSADCTDGWGSGNRVLRVDAMIKAMGSKGSKTRQAFG